MSTYFFSLDAFGDEQLTISTSAVSLTAATYAPTDAAGATKALVTVEDNPVRMRLEGTDPTASVGHELAAGDSVIIEGTDAIRNAKFIRSDAADGILHVTYFR